MSAPISTLFLDVGGVLLTNGWDTSMRKKGYELFHLNEKEVEERHRLAFDVYECGRMTLDEYLNDVIFYQPRTFSREAFKQFMFSQSQPHPDMLEYIRHIKKKYDVKIVIVSNEGRELADYRFRTYRFKEFADIFIVSSFIHTRKPDLAIYRLALDTAQVSPDEVLYIDDRLPLIQVAEKLGIQGIHHTDLISTEERIRQFLPKRQGVA
jgi:putative hydrolase of the HAD superfamily